MSPPTPKPRPPRPPSVASVRTDSESEGEWISISSVVTGSAESCSGSGGLRWAQPDLSFLLLCDPLRFHWNAAGSPSLSGLCFCYVTLVLVLVQPDLEPLTCTQPVFVRAAAADWTLPRSILLPSASKTQEVCVTTVTGLTHGPAVLLLWFPLRNKTCHRFSSPEGPFEELSGPPGSEISCLQVTDLGLVFRQNRSCRYVSVETFRSGGSGSPQPHSVAPRSEPQPVCLEMSC